MDEKELIEKSKTGSLTNDEINQLLDLIEKKNQRIHQLEKKNEILYHQNMELTQEMENIRSDFGGGR